MHVPIAISGLEEKEHMMKPWDKYNIEPLAAYSLQLNFVVNVSKIKDAKKYYNVVHEPMLKPNGDDFSLNQLILHKMPPPELHLFEGNVNHIINALSKKLED